MIESYTHILATFIFNYFIFIGLIVSGFMIFYWKWLNYKLILYARKFNFLKLWMWTVEILWFPTLLNIVNTGVCNFESERLIINIATCYENQT